MGSPNKLAPRELADLGYFSAVKANMAFRAMSRHRSELRAVRNELLDIRQEYEDNEAMPPDVEEDMQYYEKWIEVAREDANRSRREFDAACEEAGEYIGAGTLGDRALFAEVLGDKALSNC